MNSSMWRCICVIRTSEVLHKEFYNFRIFVNSLLYLYKIVFWQKKKCYILHASVVRRPSVAPRQYNGLRIRKSGPKVKNQNSLTRLFPRKQKYFSAVINYIQIIQYAYLLNQKRTVNRITCKVVYSFFFFIQN